MKSTVALATTTRTAGKFFLALMLVLAAVAVGFGGTALLVYHQFGTGHAVVAQSAGNTAERKPAARPAQATDPDAQPRRIAAGPTDRSQYTYADNQGGQPSTPAKQTRVSATVPAPLATPASAGNGAEQNAVLSDPESHFILDPQTGRAVGIDGTAGARREQDEERVRDESAPRPVAVQTPEPEVRVASPVLEDGQPVVAADAPGSQFKPVRRALPLNDEQGTTEPRGFNVAEYAVSDLNRPVLRAQPVAPAASGVPKTARAYRLSDGSQTVSSF